MNDFSITDAQETFIQRITSIVINQIWRHVFYGFMAIAILSFGLKQLKVGLDETDNPDSYERSQLSIRTDHKTGCQYLAYRSGGLTPRLDSAGGHMGCKAHPSIEQHQ